MFEKCVYMRQDLVMETIMHFIFQSCVLRNTGINIYYFTGKINMVKKVCKPHNCNYFFFNYLNYCV